MMIVNRVPELVAAKFGGDDKVNISEVAREMVTTYSTVHSWIKGKPIRADFDMLERWCKYLGCQPGDILTYEPDGGDQLGRAVVEAGKGEGRP